MQHGVRPQDPRISGLESDSAAAQPLLKLDQVHVRLQGVPVVNGVSFQIQRGEIGCLLGPSGCGKTTLLRTIAGFEQPASGTVHLADELLADSSRSVSPEDRKIGMVFQDLALFPHLTVARNIAFGITGRRKKDSVARVRQLLELVDMTDHADKYPHELSGGQQQRISLIRAMAPEPELLLLDEPFSSQDTERRVQLAHEVREILKHEGVTAILVTHDQHEAFAIADNIGVFNHGELRQWDGAYNLYHQPTDRFVADFIGEGVFVCGNTLDEHWLQTELGQIGGELSQQFPIGTEVELLVRPDDVIHDDESPNQGTVISRDFRGANHLYTLRMPGSTRLLCLAPSHHNHQIGERIGVKLILDHLVVFRR
ncbi:MAG: ABC transporter ATP-binding protein [Gammaproteobacteria bacterium]|nr:ABC transporter ATP-binding protein [Gammaproteobacteria bacterium]